MTFPIEALARHLEALGLAETAPGYGHATGLAVAEAVAAWFGPDRTPGWPLDPKITAVLDAARKTIMGFDRSTVDGYNALLYLAGALNDLDGRPVPLDPEINEMAP